MEEEEEEEEGEEQDIEGGRGLDFSEPPTLRCGILSIAGPSDASSALLSAM